MAGKHYEADDLLERGVLADMSGKPQPALFRQALARFKECSAAMALLDRKMGELIAIHEKGKPVPEFGETLRKILEQGGPVPRVSLTGVRYANVARDQQQPPKDFPKDLASIMAAQRSDLQILKKQLDGMIAAFTDVMPLGEKGEFSAALLSGRHGFADKVQQSVYLTGVFVQFYVSTCMATIDATMQVYPKGLEWLKGGAPPKQKGQ